MQLLHRTQTRPVFILNVWHPGQSVTMALDFYTPTGSITYNLRVFAGAGTR